MSKDVNVVFNRSEALVLFEFLSRFSTTDQLTIEHPAEQRVLWDLQCSLEERLNEPLNDEYDQALKEARESVKDRDD